MSACKGYGMILCVCAIGILTDAMHLGHWHEQWEINYLTSVRQSCLWQEGSLSTFSSHERWIWLRWERSLVWRIHDWELGLLIWVLSLLQKWDSLADFVHARPFQITSIYFQCWIFSFETGQVRAFLSG